MSNKLIVILVVLAIAGVGGGYYAYNEYNRTNVDIAELEATSKVTSDEVYSVFSTDTAKANREYLGKVLEVSGMVESAEATSDTTTMVILAAEGSMGGGVQASLKAGQDATKAPVGAAVHLKCRCTGVDDLFGSVVMMDCLILQ